MPNDIENIKIQKELEKIRLYKSKIKELIQDFVSKEFSANILTDEEKEQAIKLYSSCISFMNKEFYGYSIYNLNSKIKENGIYLPNKDFLNTLNYKHLLYYRSILSKLYEELSSQNILTHNLIYAISMKVGLRGFIYFNEQEHKRVLSLLEWAKENGHVTSGICDFVISQQWRTYELLKDGDFGIFNTNELV